MKVIYCAFYYIFFIYCINVNAKDYYISVRSNYYNKVNIVENVIDNSNNIKKLSNNIDNISIGIFNYHNLRLEIEYIKPFELEYNNVYFNIINNKIEIKINNSFMFNLYYDIINVYNIIPYIGFGLGFDNRSSKYTNKFNNEVIEENYSKQSSLSNKLFIGLYYKLSNNLIVDSSIIYNTSYFNQEDYKFNIHIISLSIGFAYLF